MPDHSLPSGQAGHLTTAMTPAALPLRKLEPDAISVTQDVIIGMASSAPAASVGLTLAALAAATAYGSGAIILLTAVPMLIIANAYRRLNLWNANCGASFEWVGRAINPYLGFLTGWLMIAAYIMAFIEYTQRWRRRCRSARTVTVLPRRPAGVRSGRGRRPAERGCAGPALPLA